MSSKEKPEQEDFTVKPPRKKADPKKCARCNNPIVYRLTEPDKGQYSDPVAEHRRDTGPDDRFLKVSWLSATSIRDRKKELAARCEYGFKPDILR